MSDLFVGLIIVVLFIVLENGVVRRKIIKHLLIAMGVFVITVGFIAILQILNYVQRFI